MKLNSNKLTLPDKGSRLDDVGRKNECRWNEHRTEDSNRFQFALTVICAWVCFVLFGCAPHVLTSPSLDASRTQNAAIKQHVAKASADINQVLKDNALLSRPDLTLTLQDANGQLVAADVIIGQQASELNKKQSEIDSVTAKGNQAIEAYNATGPKHVRDLYALIFAWWIASFVGDFGPLIFKEYPILIFFPTWMESAVCSIAGFCVAAGVVSILILFGVL